MSGAVVSGASAACAPVADRSVAPGSCQRLGTLPTPDEVTAAARRLGSPELLVATVLDIAGARALALDALLRLSAIEWSAEISSAMVECTDRPRLLMNPAFVERWCTTRERLATLLLHELSHISMGHTRLFPRPTLAHNIACDAVINRELLSTALGAHADVPAMATLFTDYYSSTTSPWFLLRPPPGWPTSPEWNASRGCPSALRAIHRRLYSTACAERRSNVPSNGPSERHGVMYGEIVAALQAAALTVDGAAGMASGGGILSRLLGGHGSTAAEQAMLTGGRDALAAEALASALAPLSGQLAGRGGDPFAHQIEKVARRSALERALRALIRRAFQSDAQSHGPAVLHDRPARGVDPSRDRRGPARIVLASAFGAPRPLMFDTVVLERRATPRDAIVYLDVSSSMFGVLPALHAALVPLRHELRPRIHAFSTAVVPIRAREFDRGCLPTTGGTSITPVLEHLLAVAAASRTSRTHSAVVLTDGYFEAPGPSLARAVIAARLRIHLGVAGTGPLHDGATWVASATRLPSV